MRCVVIRSVAPSSTSYTSTAPITPTSTTITLGEAVTPTIHRPTKIFIANHHPFFNPKLFYSRALHPRCVTLLRMISLHGRVDTACHRKRKDGKYPQITTLIK